MIVAHKKLLLTLVRCQGGGIPSQPLLSAVGPRLRKHTSIHTSTSILLPQSSVRSTTLSTEKDLGVGAIMKLSNLERFNLSMSSSEFFGIDRRMMSFMFTGRWVFAGNGAAEKEVIVLSGQVAGWPIHVGFTNTDSSGDHRGTNHR